MDIWVSAEAIAVLHQANGFTIAGQCEGLIILASVITSFVTMFFDTLLSKAGIRVSLEPNVAYRYVHDFSIN